MNRDGGRNTQGGGWDRDDDLLLRVEPLVQSVVTRFARDRIERERLVETDGEVTQAVDTAPDPLAAAATAELRVRIGSALARLPAEQRRLLLLRYWYGLSAIDIARRESLPASTVRNRLSRACLRLRRTPELACYAPRRPSLWSQGPGNGMINGSNTGAPPALGEAAP